MNRLNKIDEVRNYYQHYLKCFSAVCYEDMNQIIIEYVMDLEYEDRKKNVIKQIKCSVLIYNDFFYRLTHRIRLIDREVLENFDLMQKFCFECTPIIRSSESNNRVIQEMCDYCLIYKPRSICIRHNGYWFDDDFITWIDYY